MVSAKSFLDRWRSISCKSAQMGLCQLRYRWPQTTADNQAYSWNMPINKIWMQTTITPWY